VFFVGLILLKNRNLFYFEHIWIYALFILGAFLNVPGKSLLQKGKQLTVITGEELLGKDKRPPVVYLRSFKDDVMMANVPGRNQPSVLSNALGIGPLFSLARDLSTSSEEEILARVLYRIGPCVAAGSPEEKLPPVGMARFYYPNDEWESKILQLMKEANLVIMRAGTTDGFWRELEMSVEHLDPRKVMILLPYEPTPETNELVSLNLASGDPRGSYRVFAEKADKILPEKLPGFEGKRLPEANLTGVVWFRDDWKPRITCFSHSGDTISQALRKVFSYY
jgi:hypothetical protein